MWLKKPLWCYWWLIWKTFLHVTSIRISAGRGNESLIVQALHCFGTLLNGLRNTLNFERKNFPAVLSNPNVLPVVFQSVTHWHHLEVHHSFLLPRQKGPLAQKSDIIVYIQFCLFWGNHQCWRGPGNKCWPLLQKAKVFLLFALWNWRTW